MAKTNQIQLHLVGYQNNNRMSHAYGKYYLKVNPNRTLTTKGFLRHIINHGITVPATLMEATLTQFTECLKELLLQGIPVKLDGLGTVTPSFSSSGVTFNKEAATHELGSGSSMRGKIKGLHFRLTPDASYWDNTQSTKNLANASLVFDGIVFDGSIKNGVQTKKFYDQQEEP